MADQGQELGFKLARLMELGNMVSIFFMQTGVFNRQRRLAAKGHQEFDLARNKNARVVRRDGIDNAKGFVVHRENGYTQERVDGLGASAVVRISHRIFGLIGGSRFQRPARHAFTQTQMERALYFKISPAYPLGLQNVFVPVPKHERGTIDF